MIEQIGAFAGLAAFLGLAVLALLSFAHGRDIRRLRDWAGSAPEREAERKEQTSAMAARRAQELRELEAARTAEHEAIESREIRRRRREEGLPELTRGERLRRGFTGFGARVTQPLVLGLSLLVALLIAAGVVYAVSSSSSSGSGAKGRATTRTAQKVKPSEVEVAVLNGTSQAGLAASYGDRVEEKGFEAGPITNSNETFETSVVMFKPGHEPEAKMVSKRIAIPRVEPMSGEIAAVAQQANVAVVVGEDNAEAVE